MRLIEKQIDFIRQLMAQLAGDRAQAHGFGSRLDGTEKGGGLDLLLELSDSVENPIMLVACMSAKVPRKMHECKAGIFTPTLIPKSYRPMTSGTGKAVSVTIDNKARLLARMVAKERNRLFATIQRLFSQSFDMSRVIWVASPFAGQV